MFFWETNMSNVANANAVWVKESPISPPDLISFGGQTQVKAQALW